MDMLNVVQNLDSFKHLPIIVRVKAHGQQVNSEETYTEEETYYEDVVIKPGGFFKKAVTEKQQKTRMVTKTRTITKSLPGKEITLFEFSPIHAGRFRMESNEVKIDQDFYLGKYPVTQQQWEAVMGNNPSHFKGGSLPVETVSWDDAQIFIQKLNQLSSKKLYRLPTEEEWEYACRAGSTSEYYFGDDASQLGEYAWYNGNSGNTTHPVGTKKPNGWGLYDMAGNVWEWTDSWYDSSRSNSVLRGGSWNTSAENCRSANRNSYPPRQPVHPRWLPPGVCPVVSWPLTPALFLRERAVTKSRYEHASIWPSAYSASYVDDPHAKMFRSQPTTAKVILIERHLAVAF